MTKYDISRLEGEVLRVDGLRREALNTDEYVMYTRMYRNYKSMLDKARRLEYIEQRIIHFGREKKVDRSIIGKFREHKP